MSNLWTPEEELVLKQLAEHGCTIKDIEKVLISRTRHGIHCKADTMGLSLTGLKPKIDFEVFKQLLKKEREITCL